LMLPRAVSRDDEQLLVAFRIAADPRERLAVGRPAERDPALSAEGVDVLAPDVLAVDAHAPQLFPIRCRITWRHDVPDPAAIAAEPGRVAVMRDQSRPAASGGDDAYVETIHHRRRVGAVDDVAAVRRDVDVRDRHARIAR